MKFCPVYTLFSPQYFLIVYSLIIFSIIYITNLSSFIQYFIESLILNIHYIIQIYITRINFYSEVLNSLTILPQLGVEVSTTCRTENKSKKRKKNLNKTMKL